jgi:hypothetical protein
MTAADIAKLTGRELDARFAVQLMGWRWLTAAKWRAELVGLAMLQPPNRKGGWRQSPWGPRMLKSFGKTWPAEDERVADWDRCGWRVNKRGRVVEHGLPYFSHEDCRGLAAMIDKVREQGWMIEVEWNGTDWFAMLGGHGRCEFAHGSTLPEAFARAVLLTTLETP